MIAIVDYGMGNLRSVQKGFEKIGHQADHHQRRTAIWPPPTKWCCQAWEHLPTQLPNCGAAIWSTRRDRQSPGQAVFGICLGLQLLFDVGYEDGQHEGLGILPGEVVRFEIPAEYKVPHMGWNEVSLAPQAADLEALPNEPISISSTPTMSCRATRR